MCFMLAQSGYDQVGVLFLILFQNDIDICVSFIKMIDRPLKVQVGVRFIQWLMAELY